MNIAKLKPIKQGGAHKVKAHRISKNTQHEKKILFSDEQYKTLVRLVFYGEWMLNANKVGDEYMDKEAQEIRDYIFNQKDGFSLGDWMRETNDGPELKDEIILELLEEVFEYNEDTFWVHLVNKLAERDTLEEIHQADGYLSESEQEDILFKHEEKYEKAFRKYGIQGLQLTK